MNKESSDFLISLISFFTTNQFFLAQTITTSFINKWWTTINWQAVGVNIILIILKIILSTIIFFILHRIGRSFIQFIFKKGIQNVANKNGRIDTVRNLTLNTYRGILVFAFIYTILTIFSIPVGSLLAGAGIAGLAISFGAQGLVADVANGISILLESQLDIGDHIIAADIEGIVQDINLKTTKVKDFDGTIHYIPNRQILTLSNKSQGVMRARINLRLFPNTDLEKVRQIIQEVNESKISQYKEIVVPPKNIFFRVNMKEQLLLVVDMYTVPGKQLDIEAVFIEEYIEALTAADIDLPSDSIRKPFS